MYTLQILDRGQTFQHTLDDRPLRVGSGDGPELRLREPGIAPLHATLVPQAGGVQLQAHAPVRVNGQAVTTAVLGLGDRIEIGKAVLVVGRSVARAARPEDVLAEALPRQRRPVRRSPARFLPLVGAVLVIGVVAWFVAHGDDRTEVRSQVAVITQLRLRGDLDEAKAALARLHTAWQGATDDRLQQLDAEQGAVAATEAAVAMLRASVRDPNDQRTFAMWVRELRQREDGDDPIDRVAARLVRGRLRETLDEREAALAAVAQPTQPFAQLPAANGAAAPNGGAAAQSAATGQAATGRGATLPPVAPADDAAARAARLMTATTEAVDRLTAAGDFAQALAVIDACIGDVDADGVTALRRRGDTVRERAKAAMAEVLAAARQATAQGDAAAAEGLLAEAMPRFPGDGAFAALADALAAAQAAVAHAGAPAAATEPVAPSAPAMAPAVAVAAPKPVDAERRAATLEALRAQMDRIHDAEERSDFAAAATLLREGAALVRDRDADFAARLSGRAEVAEQCQAWHALVGDVLRAGRTLDAGLGDGRSVRLQGCDGAVLRGVAGGAEVRLGWHDVSADGLVALTQQVAPRGPAALGAASLLYAAGDAARAEGLLTGVLRAEPTAKAAVDRAVARGRGEPADGRGYTLGKNGFESARAVDATKLAQKLGPRLESALRGDRAARDAFVAAVLTEDAAAGDALDLALESEFARQVDKLDNGPLRKPVAQLAEQRAQLDRAREAAKALIYDESEYFYPYKPPAVTPERFAKYNEVQAEVDRRVDDVRRIWEDERIKLRVPATLAQELERIDWLASVLAAHGRATDLLAHVDWARALPPGRTVTIHDYCLSAAERRQLDDWHRVDAYNAVFVRGVGSAARELLEVTNGYRAMFRHQPLALVAPLDASAQGHADEMARLGYFSHFSEVPGRRTPFDRMRLAGYGAGASENIALNDSAPMAHYAWCHSSGHHRCLLNPAYTEAGFGNSGRLWVQNFGVGRVRFADPAWAASGK